MTEKLRRWLDVHDAMVGSFSPRAASVWDALLQRQSDAGLRGNTMEIGVRQGKSAGLLLMHTEAESEICLLVDETEQRESLDRALELLDCPPGPHLECLGLSADALATTDVVKDGALSFRWIHLSGDHSGTDVCRSLDLADQLLAERGVVCLDGFFSSRYPQITETVFKYLATYPHRFAMFLVGFNKGFLARPMRVHEYLEFSVHEMGPILEASGFPASICKTTWPADSQIVGIGPRYEEKALIGPDWCPQTIRV